MADDYDLDAGPDPATVAASEPEPARADAAAPDAIGDAAPVYAVGVGPGNCEYLTPRAERAVREADVVVGFETVVDVVRDETEADLLTCGYRDEAETLETFARRVGAGERGTAVLMGDPNHSGYQFVGKVQRAVRSADLTSPRSQAHGDAVDRPLRVVPGISSLQVAASRARTPMEETTFVTLHRSGDVTEDLGRLRRDVGERHLLVLPRPFDLMPGDVAADLLGHGADAGLTALVYERLTHEDEAVTRSTLGDLSEAAGGDAPEDTPFSDLSVLAVRAPSR